MRYSMRQCAGLPRACAGNHEEGPAWRGAWLSDPVLYGPSLCRIQPFKMGKGHASRSPQQDDPLNHDSCFVRNGLFKAVDRSAVEMDRASSLWPLTAFEGGRLCPILAVL
jgi:hypothetical protein